MINNDLFNEIKLYCELNKIDDVDNFINTCLKQGFTIEKYGLEPPKSSLIKKNNKEKNDIVKQVEKEDNKIVFEKHKKNIYGE